ncbi:hypothetical protein MTR_2g066270 [Medicago truncatula]|uniref:Uncharacterized protein n=1 Tax=Medicago truncatula TaxID=3880 RepID=G7ITA0_MEDTR|nr:hypothetical protein MTR_2g066270 [Medicago truncatula]
MIQDRKIKEKERKKKKKKKKEEEKEGKRGRGKLTFVSLGSIWRTLEVKVVHHVPKHLVVFFGYAVFISKFAKGRTEGYFGHFLDSCTNLHHRIDSTAIQGANSSPEVKNSSTDHGRGRRRKTESAQRKGKKTEPANKQAKRARKQARAQASKQASKTRTQASTRASQQASKQTRAQASEDASKHAKHKQQRP